MPSRSPIEIIDRIAADARAGELVHGYLSTVLGVAEVGLAEIAPDGRWRRVSLRFCELLGQDPRALARQAPVALLWPNEPGQHHLDELLDGRAAKVETELLVERAEGTTHLALTLVAAGPATGPTPREHHPGQTSIHAVLTDIGARVRAEAAAERARDELSLLFQGTSAYGMLWLDTQGRIRRCSTGAARMLGRAPESLIGQSAYVFFTSEDKESQRLEREMSLAHEKGIATDDRWHLRADGTRFWASGAVSPLYDHDGRLCGYTKIMRDLTAEKVEQEEAAYLAHHDPLTGLLNRTQLSNRLHEALARAQRTGDTLALLLLDLDQFKPVNDALGHHVGDLLLKQVAQRLQAHTRETDVVARLGGDEFVVVQTTLHDHGGAARLAEKLSDVLAQPYQVDGHVVHCPASIGVTVHPQDADDPVQLLKNADMALYQAKRDPERRHAVYTRALNRGTEQRRELGEQLREAYVADQFRLYYQPQIDLVDWKLTGVEALLRWEGPHAALPYARDFIGIAEETGLILPLGEWVLEHACAQAKAWQKRGLPPAKMSINVSGRQFADMRLLERIRDVLDRNALDYGCLTLEIDERLLTRDARARATVAELKALGVHVALDNFGEGLTSLRPLKELRIDQIKLAHSVVRHLPHSPADAAIAAGVIRLATDLGIEVVAEGVETGEQLAYLRDQGCSKAQGFLFAPPMQPDELVDLICAEGWTRINPPGDKSRPTLL